MTSRAEHQRVSAVLGTFIVLVESPGRAEAHVGGRSVFVRSHDLAFHLRRAVGGPAARSRRWHTAMRLAGAGLVNQHHADPRLLIE